MILRTKGVGIALTVVLAAARLGLAGAQEGGRGYLAESILTVKERALGQPFDGEPFGGWSRHGGRGSGD